MQALQLRPGYYDAAHNLASVYEAQQDFDRAAAQYHAAHALRPSDALCLGNLGIVLRQQGRLDESAAAYVRACLVCVLVCCVGGRHSAAAEGGAELKHDIGVKPPPPSLFNFFAHAQEAAIALQPREARGYSLLGNVRALQERLDDAEAAFVHALALAPGAQFT
jgi:cytochrome c-type biogenesis protein CcmH/NrfG